ncbi:His-Xaa-Ser system radical SAM maturase HxsB [Nanoarchaeota archaeon]
MKKFVNPSDKNDVRLLITTDHGTWIVITKDDLKQILTYDLSDEFYNILEEKGVILTENNVNQILQYYSSKYSFLFHGATLHIVLPTLRCNSKCIYCHSSAKECAEKEYDMDIETAKKTLEFIFQTPAQKFTIEFQGGEALLNFELFKYIVEEGKRMAKAKNKIVNFVLVSNLINMNNKFLDFITKEKVDLCTSLDGPKEVHDKNRLLENGGGTYDIVVDNIKKVGRAKCDLGVLMVTTRHSLNCWKEIIDEYVKNGQHQIQLKYINKLGFAKDKWDEQAYSIEEFIDFWKKSVNYMIELSKKGIKIYERFVKLILEKIFTDVDPSFLDFRNPCGIVSGQMAYNYNGDIYSCDEGRNFDIFKLGNVKENKYSDVFERLESQQLISSSIIEKLLCDNCAYKPWCGTCPVMNYAEEGNIIPKLSCNSRHLLFEMMFDFVFNKLIFDDDASKILQDWHNRQY